MPFQQYLPTRASRSTLTLRNNAAAIRNLRKNPRLFFDRLPPFLSLLCIIVGVVWLLLLPLNEYSRQTYISENALLPGQVHAYFSGSEQNVFRGYKRELEGLLRGAELESDREFGSGYVGCHCEVGLLLLAMVY